MILTICKWYTIIIFAMGALINIGKDGTSTTEYTGKYKLTFLLTSLPIWYFLIKTVF